MERARRLLCNASPAAAAPLALLAVTTVVTITAVGAGSSATPVQPEPEVPAVLEVPTPALATATQASDTGVHERDADLLAAPHDELASQGLVAQVLRDNAELRQHIRTLAAELAEVRAVHTAHAEILAETRPLVSDVAALRGLVTALVGGAHDARPGSVAAVLPAAAVPGAAPGTGSPKLHHDVASGTAVDRDAGHSGAAAHGHITAARQLSAEPAAGVPAPANASIAELIMDGQVNRIVFERGTEPVNATGDPLEVTTGLQHLSASTQGTESSSVAVRVDNATVASFTRGTVSLRVDDAIDARVPAATAGTSSIVLCQNSTAVSAGSTSLVMSTVDNTATLVVGDTVLELAEGAFSLELGSTSVAADTSGVRVLMGGVQVWSASTSTRASWARSAWSWSTKEELESQGWYIFRNDGFQSSTWSVPGPNTLSIGKRGCDEAAGDTDQLYEFRVRRLLDSDVKSVAMRFRVAWESSTLGAKGLASAGIDDRAHGSFEDSWSGTSGRLVKYVSGGPLGTTYTQDPSDTQPLTGSVAFDVAWTPSVACVAEDDAADTDFNHYCRETGETSSPAARMMFRQFACSDAEYDRLTVEMLDVHVLY